MWWALMMTRLAPPAGIPTQVATDLAIALAGRNQEADELSIIYISPSWGLAEAPTGTTQSPWQALDNPTSHARCRRWCRARHEIDSERHRYDADEIGKRDMLAEQQPPEQHAERGHDEVIGARGRRSGRGQEVKPQQIADHRDEQGGVGERDDEAPGRRNVAHALQREGERHEQGTAGQVLNAVD